MTKCMSGLQKAMNASFPTVSQRDLVGSVLIFISKLQFVLGFSRLWKLIPSPSSRNTLTSVKHIFVFLCSNRP